MIPELLNRYTQAFEEISKTGHAVYPRKNVNGVNDPIQILAYSFASEENDGSFRIGTSHWPTNRAFVYCIEAARALAQGEIGVLPALKLIEMARKDVSVYHNRRKAT